MSEKLVNEQAVIDVIDGFNVFESRGDQIALEIKIRELPSAEPHTFTVIDTKTGKEADTYKIALKEEWAKNLCYCDMEGFAIEEDGTLILLDECGRCAYCPQGRFEVKWNE